MPFVGLLFASNLLLATADGPPAFDVNPSCGASESVDVESPKSCQDDEHETRKQLLKDWNQYSASDRSMCSDLTEDFEPSYVELLSCLQIMKQATQIPEASSQASPE